MTHTALTITSAQDAGSDTESPPRSQPRAWIGGSRFVALGRGFVALGPGFVVLGRGFVALGRGFVAVGWGVVALGRGFVVLGRSALAAATPRPCVNFTIKLPSTNLNPAYQPAIAGRGWCETQRLFNYQFRLVVRTSCVSHQPLPAITG